MAVGQSAPVSTRCSGFVDTRTGEEGAHQETVGSTV
jgi:hypothetical protein